MSRLIELDPNIREVIKLTHHNPKIQQFFENIQNSDQDRIKNKSDVSPLSTELSKRSTLKAVKAFTKLPEGERKSLVDKMSEIAKNDLNTYVYTNSGITINKYGSEISYFWKAIINWLEIYFDTIVLEERFTLNLLEDGVKKENSKGRLNKFARSKLNLEKFINDILKLSEIPKLNSTLNENKLFSIDIFKQGSETEEIDDISKSILTVIFNKLETKIIFYSVKKQTDKFYRDNIELIEMLSIGIQKEKEEPIRLVVFRHNNITYYYILKSSNINGEKFQLEVNEMYMSRTNSEKQEKLSVLLNGFKFQDPEFKPTYRKQIIGSLKKSENKLELQDQANKNRELQVYYDNLGNLYKFGLNDSEIIKIKLRNLGLKYKESETDGACLFHSLLACEEYKSKMLPEADGNLKYPNNEILELKNKLYDHLFQVIGNQTDSRRNLYLQAIGIQLGKEDLLYKDIVEQIIYFERYKMHMIQTSSWGGDTEIALYCNLEQTRVNVYATDKPSQITDLTVTIFEPEDSNGDPVTPVGSIHLFYHGSHYSSLHEVGQ